MNKTTMDMATKVWQKLEDNYFVKFLEWGDYFNVSSIVHFDVKCREMSHDYMCCIPNDYPISGFCFELHKLGE